MREETSRSRMAARERLLILVRGRVIVFAPLWCRTKIAMSTPSRPSGSQGLTLNGVKDDASMTTRHLIANVTPPDSSGHHVRLSEDEISERPAESLRWMN